jgi:toluene monooxygenase system ferredoxin subunit
MSSQTTAGVRWVDAVGLDELWEGEILDVDAADEPVLLAHLPGGEVKAYQGLCPHQEVLLADGHWDEDSGILECRGHNWQFDLRAGLGTNPAGCPLYAYPVEVTGDRVMVGIPQDGLRHYNRCPGA